MHALSESSTLLLRWTSRTLEYRSEKLLLLLTQVAQNDLAVIAQIDHADRPSGRGASLERVVVHLPKAVLLLGQVGLVEVHQSKEDTRRYLLQIVLGQIENYEACEMNKCGWIEKADMVVSQIQDLE